MKRQTLVRVFTTLTLISSTLLGSIAIAQMRLMVSDPAANFRLSPIQKELKLSPSQIKSLNEISEKFRTEIQTSLGSAMSSGKNPQSVIDEISGKSQKKVSGVLNAGQRSRYAEICFQIASPSDFLKEPILSRLKITPAQKTQIQRIGTEFTEQSKAMAEGGTPSPGAKSKVKANKAQARNRIIALLSKTQQAELAKASGVPVAGLN